VVRSFCNFGKRTQVNMLARLYLINHIKVKSFKDPKTTRANSKEYEEQLYFIYVMYLANECMALIAVE